MDVYTLGIARLDDAPRIAAMSQAFVEAGLAPSWPAERIVRHLRDPESIVLTAKHAGDVLGFAIMQYGDDSAHLNLLAVSPRHRRQGIGRRLVTWLEKTAFTAGTFVIRLELRAGNAGALAFYERLGYRIVGRMPGYYQGIEDALRMARDLRPAR